GFAPEDRADLVNGWPRVLVREGRGNGRFIRIEGGAFEMGGLIPADDAPKDAPGDRPTHTVTLPDYYLQETEVTNEQFARFVEATKYVTTAERSSPEPGALTFVPPVPPAQIESLGDPNQWWHFRPGANWRHPEGPESDIRGREKHPVVQVSWEDATAYAQWAGKRLPTEAEWEYAARGGLTHTSYVWGNEKLPGGRWMANLWQGTFPREDTAEDRFKGTAPVGSFPANGHGLFDVAGNVWEWCSDWYVGDFYSRGTHRNPTGPDATRAQAGGMKRVMRGGSFLCSDSYSLGYRPSARMKALPETRMAHLGFRCVRSGTAP
ncbi:MAG: formylglycine-generating enzyme family protein, partial [Verrucomicrobiota bacterium]